jgi:hypothetical protein
MLISRSVVDVGILASGRGSRKKLRPGWAYRERPGDSKLRPPMPNERVDRVGLCAGCVWVRVIENRKGSKFYRCGRSDVDPSFPRYPPLPVLRCRGYDPGEPEPKPQGSL